MNPLCRLGSPHRSVLKQSAPGHLLNGWDQCWTGIVFFFIPLGHEYLTLFLFTIPFGSIYHASTFIPR